MCAGAAADGSPPRCPLRCADRAAFAAAFWCRSWSRGSPVPASRGGSAPAHGRGTLFPRMPARTALRTSADRKSPQGGSAPYAAARRTGRSRTARRGSGPARSFCSAPDTPAPPTKAHRYSCAPRCFCGWISHSRSRWCRCRCRQRRYPAAPAPARVQCSRCGRQKRTARSRCRGPSP